MVGLIEQPKITLKPIAATKTANAPIHSATIEDWQITSKYKRRPISQEEIDFINVNSCDILNTVYQN